MAFLDAAFDAQVSRNPQFLTALGSKEKYDQLRSSSRCARNSIRTG